MDPSQLTGTKAWDDPGDPHGHLSPPFIIRLSLTEGIKVVSKVFLVTVRLDASTRRISWFSLRNGQVCPAEASSLDLVPQASQDSPRPVRYFIHLLRAAW